MPRPPDRGASTRRRSAPPLVADALLLHPAGPAYDGTSPTAANLDSTDLAYYFCLETTKTGIKLPSGQSTSDITKFVSNAHAKGAKAIITVGGWDGGM